MRDTTPVSPEIRSRFRSLLDGWLAFVRLLATVQMVVMLTVVYWTFIPFMYIPFGLITDPLHLRRTSGSGWREREVPDDMIEHMLRQW